MICFIGDRLVPPELCRLLYQSIPEKLHVPVIFRNRKAGYFASGRGSRSKGVTRHYHGVTWIELDLNGIYGDARGPGSRAGAAWKSLLGTCYHEFGHVATTHLTAYVAEEEYETSGAAYRYVERVANDWRDQRLALLLSRDPRLAQPRTFSGYFGARLSRELTALRGAEGGKAKGMYVSERRFMKTGAQFSAGDALSKIGFPPWAYPSARRVLKRLCPDIGKDYRDAAGRRHKLYIWGDLPVLAARMETASIPEKLDHCVSAFRRSPEDIPFE